MERKVSHNSKENGLIIQIRKIKQGQSSLKVSVWQKEREMGVDVLGILCDLEHFCLRSSNSNIDSRGSVPLENQEVYLGPFQPCLWISAYFNRNVTLCISSMPWTVAETFTDIISRSIKIRRKVTELKSTCNYSGKLSSGLRDSHVKMHRKQLKSNTPDDRTTRGGGGDVQ